MKIDTNTPQPCPSCGAEMVFYADEYGNRYGCSWFKCGLFKSRLTLRELNILALLARLGEVDAFLAREDLDQVCAYSKYTQGVHTPYTLFLKCVRVQVKRERNAILAALGELESAQ